MLAVNGADEPGPRLLALREHVAAELDALATMAAPIPWERLVGLKKAEDLTGADERTLKRWAGRDVALGRQIDGRWLFDREGITARAKNKGARVVVQEPPHQLPKTASCCPVILPYGAGAGR
jgi:hypothetical protein